MTVPLALLVLLSALAVWRKERTSFLTESLFFVRVPLFLGSALALLPSIGPRIAPSLLGNVFTLDTRGAAIVAFAATLALWSVAFTARLTWISTPARHTLSLSRELRRMGATDGLRAAAEHERPSLLSVRVYVLAGLGLTAPLLARMALDSGLLTATAGYSVGFAAAALVLLGARRFPWKGPARRLLLPAARSLPPFLRAYHEAAAWFFSVTLACYAGFFLAGHPLLFRWSSENLPALTYVYLLGMLVNWVLAAAAFQLDSSRVPLLTGLLVAIVAYQALIPGPHTFEVLERTDDDPPPAIRLLERSWQARGRPETVAFVACSGGGIVASYWTAWVLKELESDPSSPLPDGPRIEGFGDRVLAASAVSGGGIGAMLWVDAFQEGPPPPGALERLTRSAGATSLSAALWGLCYLDASRILLAPLLGPFDRGWAIERVWGRRLGSPRRTLGDWLPGIEDGWRPLLIFNATLQETGERLLLAPSSFGPSRERMRRSLAPGLDLRVTTAARLAATFPLVLPPSRPERPDAFQGPPAHVVDGGYYDNSGVVSVLETIADLAPGTGFHRVALVVIQASPECGLDPWEAQPVPPLAGGFLNNWIGPLQALFRVRTASQSARNRFEIELFRRSAALEQIVLETFLFQLPPDQPLSWHLTPEERRRIEAAWPGRHPELLAELRLEGRRPGVERELAWLERVRERNAESLRRLRTFLAPPSR